MNEPWLEKERNINTGNFETCARPVTLPELQRPFPSPQEKPVQKASTTTGAAIDPRKTTTLTSAFLLCNPRPPLTRDGDPAALQRQGQPLLDRERDVSVVDGRDDDKLDWFHQHRFNIAMPGVSSTRMNRRTPKTGRGPWGPPPKKVPRKNEARRGEARQGKARNDFSSLLGGILVRVL